MSNQLTDVREHFAFGKNWRGYAANISEAQIIEAERGLMRLVPVEELRNKTFLDIGCGSGIHSLAALRMGVRSVFAVDIDAECVDTTKALLDLYAPTQCYSADVVSVFDLPSTLEKFDIVYSWGVLHHTGDLTRALQCAADMVAPGGILVIALYRRIWLDWFWRLEKRWYRKASTRAQNLARKIYILAFRAGIIATGRNFKSYVNNYKSCRGMSFYHDVHDWLGGYPYESISADEVHQFLSMRGFSHVRSFVQKSRLHRHIGLFGSGCDEYVYKRAST